MRHTGKGSPEKEDWHLEGLLGTAQLLQPWPAPARYVAPQQQPGTPGIND